MKKRHQPENDGKTGQVGKMGEDTENNIGKKYCRKMVRWSLQNFFLKKKICKLFKNNEESFSGGDSYQEEKSALYLS